MNKRKAKIFKRRRRFVLILFALLLTSSCIIGKKIYLHFKCKSLEYSIDYHLTDSSYDNALLRVQDTSLIFSHKDLVIIKAYGLKKEKPHKSLIIQCRFIKNNSGSWILDNSFLVDN